MERACSIGVLIQKDIILLVRRRCISTLIRALIFPIILTVVVSSVKQWTASTSGHGIGLPAPLRSLPDAFALDTSRKDFVIVNRRLPGDDVKTVIKALADLIQDAGRTLHVVPSPVNLHTTCPVSARGYTPCFGAVDFLDSPDSGALWNYTLWQDSIISGADVRGDRSPAQIYSLPLQHAVNSLIAQVSDKTLPTVQQYPFTSQSQAQVDAGDTRHFLMLVVLALGFVFFLALVGVAYHLPGHVVREREAGITQLIDAQIPTRSPWTSLVLRATATHLSFDLVYAPGWVVSGALLNAMVFSHSNAGWFILSYLLTGLAMTSYAIFVSSLFRRVQLSAICSVIAAVSMAMVVQFAESGAPSTTLAGVLATAVLFPSASFVQFLNYAAIYEVSSLPINMTQQPPVEVLAGADGMKLARLPPGIFLGFLVLQTICYPIFALIVERCLWANSFRGRRFTNLRGTDGTAVRIKGLTKRYRRSDKPAVGDLFLDLYAGSITVLLGANGSGKSSTLACISGLQSFATGEIDIDDSEGLGIGLCPQRNIMWDELTVEEHIMFFQQLKAIGCSRSQSRDETQRLIRSCDLTSKMNVEAKTLSGGQKRKLQLAMMLAGGSKVCCIDEVSSGIDPIARKKIWDILLNERGQRTILLTTHFLDEAEVLADWIAILSSGQLRAEGSVSSLKASLGDGYQVVIRGHQPGSVYSSPTTQDLAAFLGHLEVAGVTDFLVQGPTIEKIFLRLAEEMNHAAQETREFGSMNLLGDFFLHTPARTVSSIRQTWVLFRKRLTIMKRNPSIYLAALLLPLAVAGLVSAFFQAGSKASDTRGLQCRPEESSPISKMYSDKPASLDLVATLQHVVLGPTSENSAVNWLAGLVHNGHSYNVSSSSASTIKVTTRDDFIGEVRDQVISFQNRNSSDLARTQVIRGGLFFDTMSPIFAWQADGDQGSDSVPKPLAMGAIMDMAMLNQTISFSYNTFGGGEPGAAFYQSTIAVIMTLGFAVFPGLLALYPTQERLRRVRAMQYSNGITSGPLWTAHALFDLIFVFVIAILTVIIWSSAYRYWYGLPYMFVVFIFYGAAAVAYSYIIGLFVKSQLAALAMTCVVNIIFSMIYLMGTSLISDMASVRDIPRLQNTLYFAVGLICPAISLMRALYVTLNIGTISCDGLELSKTPSSITLFGGPILYLVIQFLVLLSFMIWWESGRTTSFKTIGRLLEPRAERPADESWSKNGVREAGERRGRTDDGLQVQHVSKTFKKSTSKAVDDVSFDVLPGEKFALLGPNGAGKSTTIDLIRGETRPDRTEPAGSIWIAGVDTTYASQYLGVCPQFDAMDSMTVAEHLHFYARSRGLSKTERLHNIHQIVTRIGLGPYMKKMVHKLSGGTLRKVSLAIALVANPQVLILDEPTSGMDAAAKRALWSALRTVSPGRSLLITTHSMEEADSLCDRAGIMASRMLASGSVEDLHRQHSDRVYVQLVHRDAPRSTEEDMRVLWAWVESTFLIAGSERSVNGQIRFSVPIHRRVDDPVHFLDGSSMGKLFMAVEASRPRLALRDYSIRPATLDQVFLNVVGRHEFNEENEEAAALTADGARGSGITRTWFSFAKRQ